jgi:hypothetical protein
MAPAVVIRIAMRAEILHVHCFCYRTEEASSARSLNIISIASPLEYWQDLVTTHIPEVVWLSQYNQCKA